MEAGEFEKNEDNPEGVNMYARVIEDADGLDKIEGLQTHENTDIYNLAVNILENYLGDDEDQSQPVADPDYPFWTLSFSDASNSHCDYQP